MARNDMASFGTTTYVCSLCNQRLLSKIFWTHVCITRDQPRVPGKFCLLQHCLKQGFIPRSPTSRVPEAHRKNTQTSSYIYPSLRGIETIAPSSAPTTAPKLLSTATKTPPDVCLLSSVTAFSSVILAGSAANLHPSLASLSNCSSISSFLKSVLYSKEDIALSFVSSHILFSVLQRAGCNSIFLLLSVFQFCPSLLAGTTFFASVHPLSLICTSILLCGPFRLRH